MSSRCCWCVSFAFSVFLLAAAMTLQNATPVRAAIGTWPSDFHGQQMAVSGGTQYVRVGGRGPAVLLLHGFGRAVIPSDLRRFEGEHDALD